MDPNSCMSEFIQLDENSFILKKLDCPTNLCENICFGLLDIAPTTCGQDAKTHMCEVVITGPSQG